jgi:hypothetical protein
MSLLQLLPLAADAPSAGGAETVQIVIATAAATVLTAALLVLGLGHRSGRITVLGRLAGVAERAIGLPGWAALPLAVAVPTLLSALWGLAWDESLHIDDGRDAGPLANPSHYFILIGLFGIFAAGWLALVLPKRGERPGPSSVRIGPDWHVPVGGLLVMACSAVALSGFPLDDVSHRLFGQDVSLWGTTHLQMLSGVAIGVVGLVILFREGVIGARERAARGDAIEPYVRLPKRAENVKQRLYYATLGGGLLAALSIYLGEFDYGVPQFRLLFHPVLIAGITAFCLVAVRALAGPGAALLSALWFIVIRAVGTVLVDPVFGEVTSTFHLYLAAALIVEVVALLVPARERPYRFAVVCGALIATLGTLAEYGWSHVWTPLPWPSHILPEAMAYSLPVAIAAACGGAFLFAALDRRPALVTTRAAITGALVAVVTVGGVIAYLRTTDDPDMRATVTLTEVAAAPERTVVATVRVDPPDAARDADWFHTIAYQGGEPLRLGNLDEIAPGVYRSEPIPVHGTWKSAIRFHKGRDMAAVPVFLPADEAIPAAEIPAPASFTRDFVPDREILQRERKDDVSRAAETAFAALILLICLGLIALIGRGLGHLAASATTPPAGRGPRRPGTAAPPERERTAVG